MITAFIMWLLQPERVDFQITRDDMFWTKVSVLTFAGILVCLGLALDIGLIKLVWKLCA
jgi:hypothetical protein